MGTEQIASALLTFTSLLAIVNPVSAIPIYVALTGEYDDARRRATMRTAVVTGTLVLVVFGLLGTFILQFFGITTEAFRIAGGLLFLGIGSDMLSGRRSRSKATKTEEEDAGQQDEVGIIPLGLPTLAGPGAITTVITLIAQSQTALDQAAVYAAIGAVMFLSWVVLHLAPMLLQRFGRTGLNVMTRVMGLIVMVVGVQFIINGVSEVAIDIMNSG